MSDIIVNRAGVSDIPSLIMLRSFLLSSGDEHYVAQTQFEEQRWRDAYQHWLRKRIVSDGEFTQILVARKPDNNEVVGCAIGIVNQRVPGIRCPTGQVGWIQTVVVNPEQRGRGIGGRIIKDLLRWFAIRGIEEISLEATSEALQLYISLGFERSGEDLLYYHQEGGRHDL